MYGIWEGTDGGTMPGTVPAGEGCGYVRVPLKRSAVASTNLPDVLPHRANCNDDGIEKMVHPTGFEPVAPRLGI